MEIKEILNRTNQSEVIELLKEKSECVMKWSDIVTQYDPLKHPIITDIELRKAKVKKNGQKERIARITYGLQKLATRRMTQMSFSIPVKRIYNTGDDELKKQQAEAIEKIYKRARIDSHNMKRFHAFFAACEICTVWFPIKGETSKRYGFESPYELKCKTYSPMEKELSKIDNALLYPLFDDNGKLEAMSFEYEVAGKETKKYFLMYTKDTQKKWEEKDGKWVPIAIKEELKLGKIPVIYLNRPVPIWEGTSENVTEIELTLSRESDIIRKNSAPLVKVRGELINGIADSGETAREVYQLKGEGDVDYVTWTQQIDAMKFMVSTLKQNIEEELQLPNLSLENVKGLGAISGESRKTLLTDAHLKVGEEAGDIVEMLEREFNVIKAYLGLMNTTWKESLNDLDCEHVITPFIQNDESATIDKYIKATGGKAILSQRTAIQQAGFVEDAETELKQIQDEDAVSTALNVFPTAQ